LRRSDLDLSLAVVTVACGLEHRGKSQLVEGSLQIPRIFNSSKRSDWKSMRGEERLLPHSVLRGMQNHTARSHRSELGGRLGSDGWNIFKFKGHDTDTLRKPAHCIQVLIRGGDFKVGDLARGSIAFGRKRMDAITHPAGCYSEHPP